MKGLIYYLILKKKGEVEGGGYFGILNLNVINIINWVYLRDWNGDEYKNEFKVVKI